MLLEQIFDALEMNNLTFVRVGKFFLNFSVTNVAENERQGALQSIISSIFNHF